MLICVGVCVSFLIVAFLYMCLLCCLLRVLLYACSRFLQMYVVFADGCYYVVSILVCVIDVCFCCCL